VPEEAFEDDGNVARAPENALDARSALPRAEDDEVADARVARALPVDDDRDAALEEGLADEELSSTR
jgi:hypothetical protein